MNLQLIFWIGLISSICSVFGQAGKKKVADLSVQYLVSLFDHLDSWENLSRRSCSFRRPCRGPASLRVRAGLLPGPARPFGRFPTHRPE